MSWRRWTVLKSEDIFLLYDFIILTRTSRVDNSSEFMQNLGFVSDSGVPEIYSFSSQIEPFLLAQSQQMPENPPAVRRESQPHVISGVPNR